MTSKPTAFVQNQQTFLSLAETASDRRFSMPYQPTYATVSPYVDDYHSSLANNLNEDGMVDIGLPGWLLPADAQKIYELAAFCDGDIFELGTYRGLSAAIMAHASEAAGLDNVVVSIDLDPAAARETPVLIAGRPGIERIHLFTAEGSAAIQAQANAWRSYRFAFIDHSHEYAHVRDACRDLHRIIDLGCFALFHDFNDPRNASREAPDYGVYQGVMDGLHPGRWAFWGIFGCCGLFRRTGPL